MVSPPKRIRGHCLKVQNLPGCSTFTGLLRNDAAQRLQDEALHERRRAAGFHAWNGRTAAT